MIEDLLAGNIECINYNLKVAVRSLEALEANMKKAQEEVDRCTSTLAKHTKDLADYQEYVAYKNTL